MTEPQVDFESLPAQAKKIVSPGAPGPMKMMASKGVIPGLKPADIVTVVAILATDPDGKIAQSAKATIAKLPPPVLNGALEADLPAIAIHKLAEADTLDHDALGRLIRMPRVAGETLVMLAEGADEKLGEIIATNEQRLLENPTVIEKLYLNKRVRMSTADRLLELAVRNDIELNIPAYKEAAAAIQNQLIAEPSDEPTFDDILFNQVEQVAQATEFDADVHQATEIDEESGEEKVEPKLLPLHAQIAQMTITQKIRRATLGTAAERLLLVRDPNRIVANAAVQSPMMRENEAVQITASRSVGEDILRIIARNREFTRSYRVKLNLIMNPRTPFTFAARLIPHLRDNDLRTLAKSKNVPSSISQAVRQRLEKKRTGRG